MSTLQVANVYFDATGNNKIVYASNAITFSTNGQEVISNGRINNLSPILVAGEYKMTFVNTAPPGYIEVSNTPYNNDDYPTLAAILNTDPYDSLTYDSNTQFKTPPITTSSNSYFSPRTDLDTGQNVYIYMKT